ncbi:MAG: hypothetical protein ACI857_002255 [Arenicella sp.]|jgi:hypothetical protein
MQVSLGLHSIVNWGEKDFNGVIQPTDGYTKYLSETYNIQYKKNNYSPGLILGLGFDWMSRDNFILRQEVSIYSNSVSEEIDFEIIDVGNGDTTGRNDYSTNRVKIGYKNRVVDVGKTYGSKVGLLGLFTKDDFRIGLGINWNRRVSIDVFQYGKAYNPWTWGRQTMVYLTHQLDADFRLEYSFGRLSAYFNFSQKFMTLKKERGARYFDNSEVLYPFSHNLDFRFPSTFTLGLQFNFKQIK